MHRTSIRLLRHVLVAAAAVVAVACADKAGPTGVADLFADTDRDSAGGEYVVSGTILRYTGVGDSVGDSLGTLEPVSGARVELYYLAPFPTDSTPGDSTPGDSIPGDSIPGDSTPPDSSLADTTWCNCGLAALRGAIDADTGGTAQPQRVAVAASGSDGSFTLRNVGNGLYRIDVTAPGASRVTTFTFLGVHGGDITGMRIALPPSP